MAYSLTAAGARIAHASADIPARRLIEVFVLVQFLWGALLFLPGAQGFRVYIRALPYVSSLALFAFYYGGRRQYRLPPAGQLLVLALLLLVVNLAHPQTQPLVGVAQCVFQFSIAAPVFWAGKAVRTPQFLNRLLWLIFAANAAGAVLGLLQIYFPRYLMPPEFSALAQSMNGHLLEAMSYEGAGGEKILRPPGLSDMPGGAAVAGMMTAVMGLAFGLRREWSARVRAACLVLAAVGMATLYLTQVRTLFLMVLAAVAAFGLVALKRGQRVEALLVGAAGLGLVVGSFAWAWAVGGRAVADRFFGMAETGLINSFQSNRGIFIEHTLNELVYEYPLGAGLGRWGMMNVYFADTSQPDAEPIWAEIQLTGWLLDGGILMWVFYGGAVALALFAAYRRAVGARERELAQGARLVLCLCLIIVGSSFAGPAFNTQLGVQFWFLTAALHGTASRPGRGAAGGHFGGGR